MTESHHQDRVFFDTFMLILGGLVAFAAVVYIIARVVAAHTQVAYLAENKAVRAQLEQRIEPVGRVALTGEEPSGPDEAAPAVVAQAEPAKTPMTGPQAYNGACVACHGSGAAGAPKFGNKAAWAPRVAKGLDVLTDHALHGFQGEKGVMPPKGGRVDLSDDEVIAAMKYMVEQSQ